MKALVYKAPGEVGVEERPYPQLESGEIIVKVDAAGICGSDLHAYHGHDPRRNPGLVLGHEMAGTVIESAAEVRVGSRVTVNPLISCGKCSYCLQGRENLCSDRGMIGMTRPGAFAEFMSLPAQCVLEIPDNVSPVHGALTEPAATAVHAINLATMASFCPVRDHRVLVLGGGAVGLLAALLLKSKGVRELDLAETNAARRTAIYRQCDVNAFDPTLRTAREGHYDLVVDAVGSKTTRNVSLESVAPGGIILHVGLQDWASEIDMRKLTLSEISLLGAYTYTFADLRSALALISDGVFGDLKWVDVCSLDEGADAFARLAAGQFSSSKVVLLPN